jgi:hypothetical protein
MTGPNHLVVALIAGGTLIGCVSLSGLSGGGSGDGGDGSVPDASKVGDSGAGHDAKGVRDAGDASHGDAKAPCNEPNLLEDGDFVEMLGSTWNGYQANIVVDSDVDAAGVPDGQFVARVSPVDGGAGLFSIDDYQSFAPNASAGMLYTASAWIAAASPSSIGESAQIAIRYDGETYCNASYVNLGASFQRVDVNCLLPPGAAGPLTIYIAETGSSNSDAFYVADVSLSIACQ